jgi:hypothetical protein
MDVTKIKEITEKWTSAGAACLLTMVQGNVFALNLPHWITAAKTATGATIIYLVCLYLPKVKEWLKTRLGGAVLIGLATFFADLGMHPTHFGYWWTEALVTAIGATVVSFVLHKQLVK